MWSRAFTVRKQRKGVLYKGQLQARTPADRMVLPAVKVPQFSQPLSLHWHARGMLPGDSRSCQVDLEINCFSE